MDPFNQRAQRSNNPSIQQAIEYHLEDCLLFPD
jgi:hypothetical protein